MKLSYPWFSISSSSIALLDFWTPDYVRMFKQVTNVAFLQVQRFFVSQCVFDKNLHGSPSFGMQLVCKVRVQHDNMLLCGIL